MCHIIKMMLDGGANPNKYDKRHFSSPLNSLTFHTLLYDDKPDQSFIDCIELLLKAGADPNVRPVNLIYCRSGSLLKYVTGHTSTLSEAKACTDKIVDMFIKNGAKMTDMEEREIMDRVNPYAKYIYQKRLEKAIQEVRDEIYAPGGVGFDQAKARFNSHIANKY